MVIAIFDGQAGSSGKGKVIGEIAIRHNALASISNAMANAGHTFVSNGVKRVFHHIPVSCVNPETNIYIGAGTVISMDKLKKEYEQNSDIIGNRKILAHNLIPIIDQDSINEEKSIIQTGSTFSGSVPTLYKKLIRSEKVKLFKGFENIQVVDNLTEYIHKDISMSKDRPFIIEGSQGTGLCMNYSGHYPFTTSRNVSVAQMLADSGISPFDLTASIMIIRPFPIRIANSTNYGDIRYSGDYGKSPEFNWSYISAAAERGFYPTKEDMDNNDWDQANIDLTEKTTVTKRVRRVFDIDIEQLKSAIMINKPTQIYLNFFNYLNNNYKDISGHYDDLYIDKYQRNYIDWLEYELGVPIHYLGTGEALNSVIIRNI